MKNLLFLLAIATMLSFTACQSPGEKAANELKECMQSAFDHSSNLEEFGGKLTECRDNFRKKYQDKMNDAEFQKDVEKKFADFYEELGKKAKEKFGEE